MRDATVIRATFTEDELRQALIAELDHENRWIPEEPVMASVRDNSDSFVKWLRTKLAAGLPVGLRHEVFARKPGFGLRPISLMGAADRVALHA